MIIRFTGLLVCAFMALGVRAQEQRMVNGRKYTVHIVETGQTLYAISRAKAVSVDVLLAANPGAQDGLSIGEELLIPVDAVVKKELRTAPVLRKDGELIHLVRKKETLFGISRLYQVDVNELLERNPDGLNLKEGMELVIPVARVSGVPANTLVPASPVSGAPHTVQGGETLFGLGQRYGVDPEAIRAANGGLPEGLKAGSIIVIPGVEQVEPAQPTVRIRERMRYKVGFLLPFSISRNDSVLAKGSNDGPVAYHETTRIATQFYYGALMAVDSLRAMGLNAEVDVVDMGEDVRSWNAVIKGPTIQEYDLFIGPFHRAAIEQLARANQRAHIVCPVPQNNKVILGMPTVSKVAPGRSDLLKQAARFVANRHAAANIIMLRPDIAGEKETQEQVQRALNEALIQRADRVRDSVLVAKPGKRDLGDLPGKLDANRLNVLVAPSDDVEYVTTLVSKLKPLAAKFKIRLVGSETWYSMASVAITDLELLDLTYASATFFDPNEPRTKAFTARFRDRFHVDVDEDALLGFDVTFFYLKALLTEGLAFPEHFAEIHTEPLHMGFRMTRAGAENGFRNELGIIVEQEDLRLIRAQ